MTNELDAKLLLLKELETKLELVSGEKEAVRKEVLEMLKKENIDQYKNDVATISKVERKTIKYILKPEEILADLEKQNLVKYFTVIPEHKEFSKQFDKDVKEGLYTNGVEVTVSETPMIRFN